ncbi:uncharacterized protein LOC129893964 [Solanum dulcamara]|uniref:uncharacterized protein LOC129893964 n=1 Tax=Solanum dulcamara TaxID=45834 RepID=UPI0024862DE5|nr:uncharacterized protein LOC129893964 [Solanum dulcamara]
MWKFVSCLDKYVKKEYKASLLISNMDISRLMVYDEQVEDDKKKDREGHLSIKAKSVRHENEQGQGKGNRSFFQKRSSNYALLAGSVAQGSKGKPPYSKCGKLHLRECRESANGCYKCGKVGYFHRKGPMWGDRAQSSSAAPSVRGNQRAAISGTGGASNRLYAMANH